MKQFEPGSAANAFGSFPGVALFLDRTISALQETFASLRNAVVNDALVTASIPTGSDVRVFHGLGESPTSWEVVGINANAVVWESSTVNGARSRYLLLQSSADVVVKLRFS
jgi:hypothetical protein